LLKSPIVCYVHEPLFRNIKNVERPLSKKICDKVFRFFVHPIEKSCIKKAKVILANSRYTRRCIYQSYKEDSSVLYPPIDTDKFTPSANQKNKIFIPGRIDPLKNQLMALKALRLINKKYRDYEVMLEASYDSPHPYYASKIESIVKKLEVVGWRFCRYKSISDSELVKYYQVSIVTLYPPRFEPFGLIPLESMACCTPVISLNEGGPRESILHGKTGFLCSNNTKEYAEYIQYILDNPEEAKKMGVRGRKRVLNEFSQEQYIKKLKKFLEEVVWCCQE